MPRRRTADQGAPSVVSARATEGTEVGRKQNDSGAGTAWLGRIQRGRGAGGERGGAGSRGARLPSAHCDMRRRAVGGRGWM